MTRFSLLFATAIGIKRLLSSDEIANDYQEYFEYAKTNLSLPYPDDWEEALNMFRTLIDVNVNGYN